MNATHWDETPIGACTRDPERWTSSARRRGQSDLPGVPAPMAVRPRSMRTTARRRAVGGHRHPGGRPRPDVCPAAAALAGRAQRLSRAGPPPLRRIRLCRPLAVVFGGSTASGITRNIRQRRALETRRCRACPGPQPNSRFVRPLAERRHDGTVPTSQLPGIDESWPPPTRPMHRRRREGVRDEPARIGRDRSRRRSRRAAAALSALAFSCAAAVA